MAVSSNAAARGAKFADDTEVPPLTKAQIAELKRRVDELKDPTRYLVVSAFSRRFSLFYDVESHCFTHNSPETATHFKSFDVACAVLRSLQGRRKESDSSLQIIRAKKTKTGLRLLEKPRVWRSDPARKQRRLGNPKSASRNPHS